ncbi:hypothetical protein GPECTOR_54g185 [Gonium pectorale]|uniref:LamG-like jellyroll fold domain-containing protein n=1 Tax=Gonium pectorale TaxID=33097 RepID=A0A150G6I4_GONPE|nr:hypothetical protein GPECTOR_54g185 [Gonium pectorale]|eukprot:KXZ45444.1 hypothetical protein GPECTOR_54g185 [Gonium pectorale]
MTWLDASAAPVVGAWTHALCTYDPAAKSLSLYRNGTLVASQPYPFFTDGLFNHGDSQPLGLGNIAGLTSNLSRYASAGSSFNGTLDEVALWGRALSAVEAAAVAAADAPLRPQTAADGAVLVSSLLERPAELGDGREVDWTAAGADPDAAFRVEVSTDRGRTWCAVTRGSNFTDDIHGGAPGGACFFPTVTLKVRVSWLADATLTSLTVRAHRQAPLLPARPAVAVGINLDTPSYYSRLLPFADAFQFCGASGWGWVRSGTDANGWPLEIDPALDAAGGFWVPGRNILLQDNGGTYPAGTYTIMVAGSGSVQLSGDGGRLTLTAPFIVNYTVASPTNTGMYLYMASSLAADPIKRVHVWLPGTAPPSLPPLPQPGSIPPASYFNPAFLYQLRSAGLKRLRFMDWGRTNNNNVAKWADRTTPASASQVGGRTRRIAIASVSCAVPPEHAAPAAAFLYEPLRVHVTTWGPHGLVTGNRVALSGTDGAMWVSHSPGAAATAYGHSTASDAEQPVLVTGPDSFVVSLATWGTPSTASIVNCTSSSTGYVTLRQSSGLSWEVMIGLANALGADAWLCVPHLADDDYVAQLAALTRDKLNGKLYLEYSNEVWNWMFDQTSYAFRMGALQLGSAAGDRHLTYAAHRSVQIFDIFDQVYAAGGVSARGKVVRVIAVQQGSGSVQLSRVRAMSGSGPLKADALAIAPYFGPNNDAVYPGHTTISVDEILDMSLADIAVTRRQVVREAAALARSYGIVLTAYEGGQHMGGAGGSCPGGCENVDALQAKFREANRSPRMRALYDRYLRTWAAEAGDVGGPFMAFSFMSGYSKWGSWGALEYMNRTAADSPKWAGLLPYF